MKLLATLYKNIFLNAYFALIISAFFIISCEEQVDELWDANDDTDNVSPVVGDWYADSIHGFDECNKDSVANLMLLKNLSNYNLWLLTDGSFQLAVGHNVNIKDDELSSGQYNSPDLLVIATNSKGLEWCVDKINIIANYNAPPPLLLLTKGLNIHNNNFEVLAQKLERLLITQKFNNINISAVGGPCLASDLANKIHSSVVITNNNLETANWLKSILKNNYYHVFVSSDVIGVEVSAAIKNIFSMIIGSAKGISEKTKNPEDNNIKYLNTSAALFSQSVYEMEIFVSYLKMSILQQKYWYFELNANLTIAILVFCKKMSLLQY